MSKCSKFLYFSIFFAIVLANVPAKAYENLCSIETRFYERKYDIQRSLLSAISLVETGKWSATKGEVTSWPWTINAEGEGMFFSTKQEAIDMVRKLQKQGVSSIDVGCMQINLKYHPDAFATLEQAFDPSYNVEYAAKFVKNLYDKHGSWFAAAKHYHSALSEKNRIYGNKILTAFEELDTRKKKLDGSIEAKYDEFRHKATQYRNQMLEKYRKNREKHALDVKPQTNSIS